jgi:hypothetical protein
MKKRQWSKQFMVVNIEFEPGEPLSPELVLVLPPELRAKALAGLASPAPPEPRNLVEVTPPPADDSLTRTLAAVLSAHVVQLVLIFVAVTAFTLALSAVANAVR